MERVERPSDLDPTTRLRVVMTNDGDMTLAIIPQQGASMDVTFCTHRGGGKSPRTLRALKQLAIAIEMDNNEVPQ